MDDLISRQAALDAMETWDKFGCDPDGKLVRYDDDKHYIPYVHYEDMVHAIKHLPSAEPETAERRRIMIIDGFQRECIEQAQLNRIDMVKDAVTGTATAKSYNVPAMQGWICPVCGRGLSPYTAVCPCKNGKEWQVTS